MRLHLPVLLAIAACLDSTAATGQIIRTNFPVADGPVLTTRVVGNTLYLGGSFEQLAPHTGGWVEIASGSGAVTGTWPPVNGDVNAAVPDGTGGWYLGGDFTSIGGVPRARLARILADGSVSDWNPGADAEVDALLLDGGVLYVGGFFANIGGVARNRLASLDAATGSPTAWNPDVHYATPGIQSSVYVLARDGSNVYAGGGFNQVGTVSRGGLAAFDATTGTLTAWNPGANGNVMALLVQGSLVYAGGSFSSIGGKLRNGLAALDAATGAATSWDPNPTYPSVLALAVSDSTIFIGGGFTFVGGLPRKSLAAISATTGLARSWTADTDQDGFVRSLAISGTTLYVGGQYKTLGGQARRRLGAVDVGTGAVSAWNPLSNDEVRTLRVNGASVFAGGLFTGIGGALRHWLGAIDIPSGAIKGWNPLVDGDRYGSVQDLEILGSTVYLAGNFTSVGGQPRESVAAVDNATGALATWDPAPTGSVYDLAVGNGLVYAGGKFTGIGGAPRMRLAALDPVTGAATSWDPGALLLNNPSATDVTVLSVGNGVVYAAGTFTQAGGQSRSGLAALDPTTGAATAWNPAPGPGSVHAILPCVTTVYVAADGYGLKELDAATAAPTSFNSQAPVSQVFDLALFGNTLYVAGTSLKAVDADTGVLLPWDPQPDPNNPELGGPGIVHSLSLVGPDVYAGGAFKRIGDTAHSYLAGIVSATVTVSDPQPAIELGPVQPNPFRSGTTIAFSLPRAGRVTARVFNVAGRMVSTLALDQDFTAGPHQMSFKANGLPNGIYLYQMEFEGKTRSGRVVLVR